MTLSTSEKASFMRKVGYMGNSEEIRLTQLTHGAG